MIYSEYLKSEDWLSKRKKIRSKSKKCSICHSTKNLHVHHLNYKNLFNVLQSDLRVLCETCHEIVHKLIKQKTITFKNDSHHSKYALIKIAVRKKRNIPLKRFEFKEWLKNSYEYA